MTDRTDAWAEVRAWLTPEYLEGFRRDLAVLERQLRRAPPGQRRALQRELDRGRIMLSGFEKVARLLEWEILGEEDV
jgi:hypothetical protein